MKRAVLALIVTVALVAGAGCLGGGTPEEKATDTQDNETYTFTKPAADADGYWTCVAWDEYGGSGDDNQMECEYVEASG